ncbi:hypothetical protein GCM10007972_17660 [Iodidimonas muriae]|uniref:DUF1311 domain-containing protein n=1 Tax=Iodidimonas muriae TaxID=261467 RepID=A0ABQ2LEP3_9PROT|nr:hypothetical protein [Iodidimonas muriae]GER08244.1 hypothetical protein JCM17843_25540 [Kordiimonadales bacterium JCM 17843]GGO12557.1 hypothetical protein GCM10007972_17660 [Iodidimonas muriae]
MKATWKTASLAAIMISGLCSQTAYAQCMDAKERAAHDMRLLQTQLMVGALQCRGRKDLGQRAYYNEFIRSHRDDLARHGNALVGYFERSYGQNYKVMLDKHVTSLANAVSSAVRTTPDFCTKIAQIGARISQTPNDTHIRVGLPMKIDNTLGTCLADSKSSPSPNTQ